MTANLRVTMIQADLAWQDPVTNRRNLAAHFRGLAGHTDLIVLPEMFTTGFSMEARSLAETMAGATVGLLRDEAAALGCAITGSLIVEDGGQHYNRLVWATPAGGLAHYDKRATCSELFSKRSRNLAVVFVGAFVFGLACSVALVVVLEFFGASGSDAGTDLPSVLRQAFSPRGRAG